MRLLLAVGSGSRLTSFILLSTTMLLQYEQKTKKWYEVSNKMGNCEDSMSTKWRPDYRPLQLGVGYLLHRHNRELVIVYKCGYAVEVRAEVDESFSGTVDTAHAGRIVLIN